MNQELSNRIRQKLVATGEEERLKELLKTRLLSSGWRDELSAVAREYLKAKGVQHVDVEELQNVLLVEARKSIPDTVKKELLVEIRDFVMQHEGIL
ncbi:transcription and mRNA export factor ENY2 [Galendromus occidentalis]|uniref:Transcription and mRNA export factor ENY2 n=1 Tax=Galendromus occidentalis TaxID=34638 RepID=A0AAJ6VUK2_9ACAR|nr:transcription and mRNA export factor ENY2 [Galendromus occidentalis]